MTVIYGRSFLANQAFSGSNRGRLQIRLLPLLLQGLLCVYILCVGASEKAGLSVYYYLNHLSY